MLLAPCPDPPDRMTRLGAALRGIETRHFAAARDEAASVLAQSPGDHPAELLLGMALGGLGRARAAAAFLHRARQPGFRHPVYDVASLLPCRLDVAAQYQASLRLSPEDGDLRRACAEALIEAGIPGAALDVLAQAPDDAATLMLAGIAQHDRGALDEALALFCRAAALAPNDAGPWSNIALVLKVQGQFDTALAAYDRAVALCPDDARIRVNRAVALLRAGRMEEAWADYEYRFALPGHAPVLPLSRLLPDLSRTDVTGRTVLVTHEEGFGDTLHFVRYLPLLARRGARVVLAVPQALASLMTRVEGVAAVIDSRQIPPAFDWHCPMFSLPRAFGTTLATIPARVPYLRSDPERVAAWETRLPSRRRGVRIGLAWAGQARPWAEGFTALDTRRSLDPILLSPLAALRGATFVSLQKDARTRPPFALFDPMPDVDTFDDTAAIVAGLDLIVSVDTSVVHLAGGLGKPVFLLDRYDNCWRWFSGRIDSPWYPALRIFRQPSPNDWGRVMTDVAAAVDHFVQLRLPG
jgi:Flp pilus assembly protein TadD